MVDKDTPEVTGVEYVPVPAWNQPQPTTPNTIIAALGGGGNAQVDLPSDGDVAPKLEGFVPRVNRNGTTSVEDRLLALDKVARLHLVDNDPDGRPFVRNVDPRDNDNAPDEWPNKKVAPAAKK